MQNEFPLRPIEKPSFSELALTTEEHVSIVPALSTGGLNNAKADKLETARTRRVMQCTGIQVLTERGRNIQEVWECW